MTGNGGFWLYRWLKGKIRLSVKAQEKNLGVSSFWPSGWKSFQGSQLSLSLREKIMPMWRFCQNDLN